ncbi:MAG: DNA polymerase III subunit delta' [Legionellales bacterium]|nr:DNA polymerase III subunit delta' [Legionellales bacterium]|tara:strand:+ start:3321 stop:4304 length:984 start_codon:yes stop_codon:yes gene_type:complete
MMLKHYPWHQQQWENILSAIYNNKLAHALLLKGESGLGKLEFAKALAQKLLCQQNLEQACHQCPACHWFAQETHPDYYSILEYKAAIKVDEIRSLLPFLQQKSHCSTGKKVIIIALAEYMNQAAANALLKVLEEPTDNTYFILITENSSQLKPTIKSRCQFINFPTCHDESILTWFMQQGYDKQTAKEALWFMDGRPLEAIKLIEGDLQLKSYQLLAHELQSMFQQSQYPEVIIRRWETLEPINLIKQLQHLIALVLMYKNGTIICAENQLSSAIMKISGDIPHLHKIYDVLLNMHQLLITGYTLNKLLMIDSLIQVIIEIDGEDDE